MKSFLILSALCFTILSGTSSWANAGQCELCINLEVKTRAIKEAGSINDEMARAEKITTTIKAAGDVIRPKLESKSKLSATETKAVLKFIAETREQDDLLQIVELIYADFKARKKFYDARLSSLSKVEREAVKAQIKEFESRNAKGNG